MGDLLQAIVSAKNLADETYDTTFDSLCKKGCSRFVAMGGAAVMWVLVLLTAESVGIVVTIAGPVFMRVLPIIVDGIEGARGTNAEQFDKLTATAVNAYLNTSFSPDTMGKARRKGGEPAAQQAVGKALFDLLEQRFTQGGPLSPDQGERAAHAFTGYGVDIATENAFQGLLVEIMGAGQLDTWAEFGDLLQRVMGIERLQRRAIGNLIETCIGKPYDWKLNAKYRPTRLSVASYIRAHLGGKVDKATLDTLLAQEGYSDRDIALLVDQYAKDLSAADIERMWKWGKFTRDEAVAALKDIGYTSELATRRLDAADLSAAESDVGSFISELERRVLDGRMELETYREQIEPLPLTPSEKLWKYKALGLKTERPRKQLSLSQMTDAFKEGIITLFDFEEFLVQEGYSDRDLRIVEYLTLLDVAAAAAGKGQTNRAKKAAEDAAKIAPKPLPGDEPGKGKPVPPKKLSLSQIQAAFKSSFVSFEEYDLYLAGAGYSPRDRNLLELDTVSEALAAAQKAQDTETADGLQSLLDGLLAENSEQ